MLEIWEEDVSENEGEEESEYEWDLTSFCRCLTSFSRKLLARVLNLTNLASIDCAGTMYIYR